MNKMKELNNNIQEPYCSFEVSKLLYEKGLNLITSESNFHGKRGESGYIKFYHIWRDYSLLHESHPDIYKKKIDFEETTTNSSVFSSMEAFYLGDTDIFPQYHSPTHSLAIEWIRINFGIWVEVFIDDNTTFGYLISRITKDGRFDSPIKRNFNSPQEATESALKYVLNNHI